MQCRHAGGGGAAVLRPAGGGSAIDEGRHEPAQPVGAGLSPYPQAGADDRRPGRERGDPVGAFS